MEARGTQMGIDITKDHIDKEMQRRQMGLQALHKVSDLEHQAAQNDANRKHQSEQSQAQAKQRPTITLKKKETE